MTVIPEYLVLYLCESSTSLSFWFFFFSYIFQYLSTICFLDESRNHRVSQAGRYLQGSLTPTPCFLQDYLNLNHMRKSVIQTLLEPWQIWCHDLGSLFQWPITHSVKKLCAIQPDRDLLLAMKAGFQNALMLEETAFERQAVTVVSG